MSPRGFLGHGSLNVGLELLPELVQLILVPGPGLAGADLGHRGGVAEESLSEGGAGSPARFGLQQLATINGKNLLPGSGAFFFFKKVDAAKFKTFLVLEENLIRIFTRHFLRREILLARHRLGLGDGGWVGFTDRRSGN